MSVCLYARPSACLSGCIFVHPFASMSVCKTSDTKVIGKTHEDNVYLMCSIIKITTIFC